MEEKRGAVYFVHKNSSFAKKYETQLKIEESFAFCKKEVKTLTADKKSQTNL